VGWAVVLNLTAARRYRLTQTHVLALVVFHAHLVVIRTLQRVETQLLPVTKTQSVAPPKQLVPDTPALEQAGN